MMMLLGIYILLTCLSFVIIYPFLGRILISFMSESDLNDASVHLFTKNFTMDNYQQAMKYMQYLWTLGKTGAYVIAVSIAQVLAAVWIAYGFARFRFHGRNILFGCVLLTLIVPPQVISIPLYFQFRYFNLFGLLGAKGISLLDNPGSVLLLAGSGLGLKSGLLIFMLRQFFSGFPKELEEAASIDGSGPFRTFWKIVFPSSTPMLVTAFLFSLVWGWTDTFYTSTFMPGNNLMQKQLLQISSLVKASMDTISSVNHIQISLINNAGVILFILPLLVVFIFGQRYFIESIEQTGIVG